MRELIKTISVFDDRYYEFEVEGKVLRIPSVTTVQAVESNIGLDKWKMELGLNAPEVLRQSADRGSRVHDALEKALYGYKIICNPIDHPIYDSEELLKLGKYHNIPDQREYEMVLRGLEILNSWNITSFAVEEIIYDLDIRYAGRLDLRATLNDSTVMVNRKKVTLNGEYVIDYKTGGAFPKHSEQVVAYGMAVEKMHNKNLAGAIVLYLNANTKSGVSVKVIQREDWDSHFEIFKATAHLYSLRNPVQDVEKKILPRFLEYNSAQGELF